MKRALASYQGQLLWSLPRRYPQNYGVPAHLECKHDFLNVVPMFLQTSLQREIIGSWQWHTIGNPQSYLLNGSQRSLGTFFLEGLRTAHDCRRQVNSIVNHTRRLVGALNSQSDWSNKPGSWWLWEVLLMTYQTFQCLYAFKATFYLFY